MRLDVTPLVSIFVSFAASVAGLPAIRQSAFPEPNRQGTAIVNRAADSEFVFETAPFASAHASTMSRRGKGW